MAPPSRSPWIELEEALARVMDHVPSPRTETVDYREARGRRLARAVVADTDQPPFDRSMMDGYALRGEDVLGASRRTPVTLTCTGEVPAGSPHQERVEAGTCLRIYTGARIPDGCDAVVPVEYTDGGQERVSIQKEVASEAHIIRVGSQVRRGETLLEPGVLLGAAGAAVLAMTGTVRAEVFALPRIRIRATGDELIDPTEVPTGARIRESNTVMLENLLASHGFPSLVLDRVPDTRDEVREVLESDIAEADVVIYSGGVSMGAYDHVGEVLREIGAHLLFDTVRIKPGKPLTVAAAADALVFGLPGNPVSTFVTAFEVVIPALHRATGSPRTHPVVQHARLEVPVTARGPRPELRPMRCRSEAGSLVARPVRYTGSSDLAGLARGNALAWLEAEAGELPAGTIVPVHIYADLDGSGGDR